MWFERQVGEFIEQRWGYPQVRCNYYPPFLRSVNAGEVDVYAHDIGGQRRRVLVCECKLRVRDDPDGKPVTETEVRQLECKARALKNYRQKQASDEGYVIHFEAWLVTNTTAAETAAWEAARKARIDLKTAALPGNWRSRADWKVSTIRPMEKP